MCFTSFALILFPGAFQCYANAISATSVSAGGKTIRYQTVGHFEYVPLKLCTILHFRKPSVNKSLPPRPPAAKIAPGRPPQSFKATGRSQSLSWDASPKLQPEKPHRKELVLPPRPNPGHRLYNKYTVRDCMHKNSRLVSTTA